MASFDKRAAKRKSLTGLPPRPVAVSAAHQDRMAKDSSSCEDVLSATTRASASTTTLRRNKSQKYYSPPPAPSCAVPASSAPSEQLPKKLFRRFFQR